MKPRLFSELKKIRVTVDNENKKDTANQNQHPANIPVDVYKKHFFVKDKQTEKNFDILINITKPKMDENHFKSDQYEIDTRVQKLNSEGSENRPEFLKLPTFSQNMCKENNTNTNSQVPVNASASHTYTFKKWSQNQESNPFNAKNVTESTKPATTPKNIKPSEQFETEDLQNDGIFFDSIPKDDNFVSDGNQTNETCDDSHNVYSRNTTDVSIASRQCIEKIISSLNPQLTNKNPQNLKSFNQFKIPKLVPFKKETKITSPLEGSAATTKDVRSNFKNSDHPLEGSLKKFCVKNKMMKEKLTKKMDEWICTYIQIMEHLLSDVLQVIVFLFHYFDTCPVWATLRPAYFNK